MYKYSVYNYIIESNCECKYLKKVTEEQAREKKVIHVTMIKKSISKDMEVSDQFVYSCDKKGFIGIWKGVYFEVMWKEFSMRAEAECIDKAYLILLNIPLALLIAHEDMLVLHCSCIFDEKKLYGFVGNKGVGKSTVSSLLATERRHFFSDDTICIDVFGQKVYSNYSVEKYTNETLNMMECKKRMNFINWEEAEVLSRIEKEI